MNHVPVSPKCENATVGPISKVSQISDDSRKIYPDVRGKNSETFKGDANQLPATLIRQNHEFTVECKVAQSICQLGIQIQELGFRIRPGEVESHQGRRLGRGGVNHLLRWVAVWKSKVGGKANSFSRVYFHLVGEPGAGLRILRGQTSVENSDMLVEFSNGD